MRRLVFRARALSMAFTAALGVLSAVSVLAATDYQGRVTVPGPACALWWRGAPWQAPAGVLALGNDWFGIQIPPGREAGYVYLGPTGGPGPPLPQPFGVPAPALLWLPDGTLVETGWLGIARLDEGDDCAFPFDPPLPPLTVPPGIAPPPPR
jgi:hypothetical protein